MTAAQLTANLGAEPSQTRLRAMRGPLVKALVTGGLLAALAFNLDLANIYKHLSAIDRTALALAAGVLALQYVIACLRWSYILKRLDLPVDRRKAVHIYGVGALANMLLVSIAGPSVRAVMLIRQGSDLSRAVAALTAERIAAMAAMLVCFGVAAVAGYRMVEPVFAAMNLASLALWALALLIVSAAGAWLLMRLGPVRRFASDLRLAFATRGDAALLGLSSVAVIYLGFAGVAVLASGMGLDVGLGALLTVLPVVAFVAALPVSFGGWGVREGAMVGGLTLFQVPADAAFALSISYGLMGILVVSLLGGGSALLALPDGAAARIRPERAGRPSPEPLRD